MLPNVVVGLKFFEYHVVLVEVLDWFCQQSVEFCDSSWLNLWRISFNNLVRCSQ